MPISSMVLACQCIATGLTVTEMDKIRRRRPKNGKCRILYSSNWVSRTEPAIGEKGMNEGRNIDFVMEDAGALGSGWWYRILSISTRSRLHVYNKTTSLILNKFRKDGSRYLLPDWKTRLSLKRLGFKRNYLLVSNQNWPWSHGEGILPPATAITRTTKDYEMNDAQLTTEIFGFLPTTTRSCTGNCRTVQFRLPLIQCTMAASFM